MGLRSVVLWGFRGWLQCNQWGWGCHWCRDLHYTEEQEGPGVHNRQADNVRLNEARADGQRPQLIIDLDWVRLKLILVRGGQGEQEENQGRPIDGRFASWSVEDSPVDGKAKRGMLFQRDEPKHCKRGVYRSCQRSKWISRNSFKSKAVRKYRR